MLLKGVARGNEIKGGGVEISLKESFCECRCKKNREKWSICRNTMQIDQNTMKDWQNSPKDSQYQNACKLAKIQ